MARFLAFIPLFMTVVEVESLKHEYDEYEYEYEIIYKKIFSAHELARLINLLNLYFIAYVGSIDKTGPNWYETSKVLKAI